MITQQTLKKLSSDDTIKKVTEECMDLGLSDLKLFVTNEYEDKDSIHLLGKGKESAFSLYLLRQTEKKLSQELGCQITLRAVGMLHELVKSEVLSNTTSYTSENKNGIEIFFQQQILPRANGEFFSEETLEETAEEILEQIKQNPLLWEKVARAPNSLTTAQTKIEQLKLEQQYKQIQKAN